MWICCVCCTQWEKLSARRTMTVVVGLFRPAVPALEVGEFRKEPKSLTSHRADAWTTRQDSGHEGCHRRSRNEADAPPALFKIRP